MSIRMSTSQLYSRGVNSMLDMQQAVSKTQEQIASKKRVLTPADDPVAATRILQLNQERADIGRYNNSLSLLSNRMLREETALTGISEQLQKAQEIVLRAGNAVVNADQRKYLATELQSVVDSMTQLMNSKDSSGEFLFSGYQGKTQPFVQDADGRYQYQGDEGQRFVQVGPVTSIAANDSGYQVFMNVPGVKPGVQASASAGNTANPAAQIGSTEIRNADIFAQFAPDSAVIEFGPVGNISPPGLNYSVRQISDGRMLVENVPYVSGNEIEFVGLVMRIQGRPAEGDSFIVESSNKKGVLESMQDFVADLRRLGDNSTDHATLAESISTTLGNLDNAQVQMLQTSSAIGARMNQIDSVLASNTDFELTIQTALSELQDLDYAKALSQLSQETLVLEAAQTSFVKINRLSLFNLI